MFNGGEHRDMHTKRFNCNTFPHHYVEYMMKIIETKCLILDLTKTDCVTMIPLSNLLLLRKIQQWMYLSDITMIMTMLAWLILNKRGWMNKCAKSGLFYINTLIETSKHRIIWYNNHHIPLTWHIRPHQH